jgi:hypothetical protein
MNLANTIIPKSDQWNADDLIGGPRTVTIEAVEAGSAEQPVNIYFVGDKRAYRPSKSMRRVLVALWGSEGKTYVGQRVTLYRDPAIKFGGEAVGGIRISHASGITQAIIMALTEARGKRKPHRVEPLVEQAPAASAQQPDRATLEDIGNTKAREGTASLSAWWATVPPGAVKKAVGAECLPAWKATAADADAKGGAA